MNVSYSVFLQWYHEDISHLTKNAEAKGHVETKVLQCSSNQTQSTDREQCSHPQGECCTNSHEWEMCQTQIFLRGKVRELLRTAVDYATANVKPGTKDQALNILVSKQAQINQASSTVNSDAMPEEMQKAIQKAMR